ncbi:MAG: glycosyltransferase family 4 protein [Acidocella sp.]|nr:glycosyltransferase family 4 protein [Acidocella sp.]
MKIVFITDELPRVGSAGHLAFNAAVVGWLRGQGHAVEIMLVRPRLRWPVERFEGLAVSGFGLVACRGFVASVSPRDIAAILVRRVLAALPVGLARRFRKHGRAGQYGVVDAVLGAFMTPAQAKYCQQRLAAMQPGAILVDTIFRAAVLDDPALASVRTLILAHDVFHLRHRILTSAGYQVYPAALSRAFEAEILNKAQGIVAIQPEEAAQFRAMCPTSPVYVASMPATPCPRPAHVARLAHRLVFVGGDGLPNLDGLRWFFNEIWPHLYNSRRDITLDLIGDCASAYGTLPAGVNRVGRVADLGPYLHRASLAISPLRVGTGLKIKLLDYARHGLTTIATPLSLQGFAADRRAPFIAAADSLSFYAAILQSLQHQPDAAAELDAIYYVEKYYGITTAFAELTNAFHNGAPLNVL